MAGPESLCKPLKSLAGFAKLTRTGLNDEALAKYGAMSKERAPFQANPRGQ
jgi:hypothetical protein